MMRTRDGDELISKPSKHAVMVFVNRSLNMEDVCLVMTELANSGHFSWLGEINYLIPPDCGRIQPGMMLKDQAWWKPNMEGFVTRVGISKSATHMPWS